MWVILLAYDEAAKSLAGNILTRKMLNLQVEEDMGTRKTHITLHVVSMYSGTFGGLLLG